MMNSEKESSKSASLYLIDGSAYIFRAFHALRGLSNSKGMPTNAVYGFTRMLIKLMQERAPQYAVMFFDAKGATFRHEIYAQYKANRPALPQELGIQIPYIKKVTAGFNLPVIEMPGFEADDLIGTYARKAEAAGMDVIMVTSDKDFMQLVTDRVTIWDPMKDLVIDKAAIARDYCLEPSQMIDLMGFCGDTSDNIPGVPGIGPKTALALIRQFGSMQAVYDRIDEISAAKQREKLLAHREQAFLSRRLVTIDHQAPVDFALDRFLVQAPDPQVLTRLFQELEFRQLQQEFQQTQPPAPTHYDTILDLQALDALVERLGRCRCFALNTETDSQYPMRADLVGISVAIEPHGAYYIPLGHRYIGAPRQLSRELVLARLAPVLADAAVAKVGQNIKYDWTVLRRHGIDLAGVSFDTMLASYLLNPSKRAHSLDQIALDFLDHKNIPFEDLAGKGKCALPFDQLTLDQAAPCACEDADITLRAYQVLQPQLKDLGLMPLFEEVEMPLVPVLMEMEMTGVRLDRERLHELSKSLLHQMLRLEDEICSLAGEKFNLQSSQQLGRILFEKLKLPCSKKTKKKTGYSTDVEVLTQLAEQHELPALLLRHRSLTKLKSTYVDALLDQVDPATGRIHTFFNQTITATGRLSSSDPNLQNIPIRTEEGREIRKAFIARPGWYLLSADYSQIELRILAHYSDDPILIESFVRNEDIHTRTASEVFQTSREQAPDELRRQAKVINFGIIYGMSAYGLSRELGISPKMAQTYIDQYFQRYRGVREYMERTLAQARETQRVGTLLGRLRLLPDINSSNATVRQFAERTAINTPIQGSAADLIKVAMLRTANALKERRLKSAMLLSVHDEIVFEVPEDELPAIQALVPEIMENVWDLKVPLKVNAAWGSNWAEAH
ncbi:MAG: DNA polymerase I [Desulfobacteraceae bacterium]|nr:MAG: DNA polymerase I [Desulfobacteraceae bacterium]